MQPCYWRVGRSVRVMALTISTVACLTAASAAQSTDGGKYVSFKAGITVERSEDNLKGTVAAGGGGFGFPINDAWGIEIDFWYPDWIETDPYGGRHRDILGGVAFRRTFARAGVQPYVLVGFSLMRSDTHTTFCLAMRAPFGSTEPQLTGVSCDEPDVIDQVTEKYVGGGVTALGGAGVEIPIGGRVRIVPDVRVDFFGVGVLVRPSVGISFGF